MHSSARLRASRLCLAHCLRRAAVMIDIKSAGLHRPLMSGEECVAEVSSLTRQCLAEGWRSLQPVPFFDGAKRDDIPQQPNAGPT